MEELIERVIRWVRHPLRVTAVLLATWALVGGFVGWAGLTAAMIAALFGMIAGEVLGRSSARAPVLALATIAPIVIGLLGEVVVTRFAIFPSILGTWASLNLGSFLLCGGVTLGVVLGLRAFGHRSGAANAVELASLSAAYAAAFAAHRFGAMARPLWLSDMAWDLGFDPASILLLCGGMFVVLLAVIRLADSDKRLSLFGAMLLPVIALMAVVMIDPRRLQQAPTAAEVAAMKTAMGDPPRSSEPEGVPDKRANGDGKGDKSTGLTPDAYQSHSEGEGNKSGDPGPEMDDPSRQGPTGSEDEGGEKGGNKPEGDQAEKGAGGGLPEAPKPKDGRGGGKDPKGPNSSKGGGEGEGGEGDPPPSNQPPRYDRQGKGGKDRPVAVVVLGDDYEPPSQYFYLRQAALSEFDGHRLIPAKRLDIDRDVPRFFPTRAESPRERPFHEGRTEVHGRVGLLAKHDEPVALEGVDMLKPAPNGNPARFDRMYEFTSWPQTEPYEKLMGHTAGNPTWTPEQWAFYTASPEDERYKKLADDLVATLPPEFASDPFAKALVIKAYIDKNMKYSRKERHAGVDDPTGDFLFGNMIGYCVHSSHAATYLWREAGIPARVATGYAVESASRRGSSLIVMGGNAHAWPELYLDGIGWVILDIAPAENLDPPGQPVDEDMTKLLADMARQNKEKAAQTDFRWVKDAFVSAAKGFAISVFAGTIFFHYFAKLWRRLRLTLSSTRALPRVAYRTGLDMLVESGFVREEGETREAFSRRIADRVPSFQKLTTLHVAAKFGDPKRAVTGRPEYDRAAYLTAIIGLQKELREARGFGWRWLGLVNPISFYWAR